MSPAEAGISPAKTFRTRAPQQTWDIIAPKFPHFGITRVADVTGLDVIGIPVAMAVRPLARSVSVAQGKGQTLLLAKVSAAMESIEHWHAEHSQLSVLCQDTPASDLNLPYLIRELDSVPGSFVDEDTRLEWTTATGLLTGHAIPVPLDLARLPRPDRRAWDQPGLRSSSNGLASGNTVTEAALHALHEVVERETIRGWPVRRPGAVLDLESITDPGCVELLARLASARVAFSAEYVSGAFGVPCFAAWIWSEDLPVPSLGFGAHIVAETALTRALTEAAQSRLSIIAGTREDLPPVYGRIRDATKTRPDPAEPLITWSQVAPRAWAALDPAPGAVPDLHTELARLAAAVSAVTGREPLLIDLSTEEELAVVKVVACNTGSDLDRFHPSH